MADKTISGRFQQCFTGGSNISTVKIPTTGIATGDVITIASQLKGTTVQNVKIQTVALGTGISVKVGSSEGDTTDDDEFLGASSLASAGTFEWIGTKVTNINDGLDFTLTFTGDPTDSLEVVFQVIYQKNI